MSEVKHSWASANKHHNDETGEFSLPTDSEMREAFDTITAYIWHKIDNGETGMLFTADSGLDMVKRYTIGEE